MIVVFGQLFGQKQVTELAPDLLDMVRLLLQWEPAMATRRGEHGSYPLHHALSFASAEVPLDLIQLLIDTHPEGLQQTDDDGLLPVHCYVSEAPRPSVAVLRLLSEGRGGGGAAAQPAAAVTGAATLRAQTREGQTLLHLYCRRDVVDLGVLAFLCDAHPPAAAQPDGEGRVPLMTLAEHSASLSAARMLVERARIGRIDARAVHGGRQ